MFAIAEVAAWWELDDDFAFWSDFNSVACHSVTAAATFAIRLSHPEITWMVHLSMDRMEVGRHIGMQRKDFE
ncbi:hypothetical protein V6N11_040930 [Hibiscus sabdariffa]|uniref:Uncharacterized protein n=1 Tax=Hibiscus sabdariffa TaxID=183260 RepID=A0ABR2RIY6_9ROSI